MSSRISICPMKICLKVTLLLLLLAPAAPPARSQGDSRSVRGQVRTANGTPIPSDVSVRLEEAEGVVVAQKFVGVDGKFEFTNLSGELYRLVVTAKGFQTVNWDVDMHYLATRYPNVYLSPLRPEKSAPGSPSTTSASDLAAPKKARHEYEKGKQALQDENPAEARNHLEKAVAQYPCYARAQTTLGVALASQHEFVPAESAFRKAIECDSGFLEAYVQLAVLLDLQGKYSESEANLRQGLGHFPNQWQLHYQLGAALDGLKDYQKAEQEYLKAQSINPTALPPEFHVKLADVYLKQKEWEKAYAEMQAYLRVDPNGEFAQETHSLMKRMESAGVLGSIESKGGQPPEQR